MRFTLLILLSTLLSGIAFADNGLIIKNSPHDVVATMDRLVHTLETKGITIVARIDHQKGAQKTGSTLPPTQLLIFGNPKLGTPLMTSNITVAIDLPMKALVWQDSEGQTWLGYNDPAFIASRHKITNRDEAINKMSKALNKVTDEAIKP